MKYYLSGPVATFLVGLLLTTTVAAQSTADAQPAPAALSFGIVPQQAPGKLLRRWGPVLSFLEQRTGYRFVFRTAPDIPIFEQRVAAGEYDFSYMNPYHFTEFNKGNEGYQAVAKAANKRIRGILVVHKDSSVRTLDDLQGTTLAFPAPAAFAASILPRTHLKTEGVLFDERYVSSHDSVYKVVARGMFAAGGGVLRTFATTDPAVRGQLRILWTTPGFTPHAIAVHPRVPSAAVEATRQALISMADEEIGRLTLDGLKVKGFVAAVNADWDDVRTLQIQTLLGHKK